VDVCGLYDADRVEAGVLKEALILGGDNRMNEHRRDLIISDETAFFPVLIEQVRDQFGLEIVLGEVCVVRQRDNPRDLALIEFDDSIFTFEVRVVARIDIDFFGPERIMPHPIVGGLSVSGMAKLSSDLLWSNGFTNG